MHRKILYLGACFMAHFSTAFHQQPQVAVVGAGLAGLTAAYRLQQAGLDVRVYEARQRVGGRIFSATINGAIAELGGGNLADGGAPQNILQILNELQVPYTTKNLTISTLCRQGGSIVPLNQLLRQLSSSPEDLRSQLDSLKKTEKNMRGVLDKIVPPQSPINAILSQRLEAYEGGKPEDLSTRYVETLYHMMLGGICSAHQADNDYQTTWTLTTADGGNGKLPEALAARLRHPVELGKILAAVTRTAADGYLLTFHDGSTAQPDYVVFAMPCTVYNDVVFGEGVIPPTRLQAIRQVRYGANAKIVTAITREVPRRATMSDGAICFLGDESKTLNLYLSGNASRFGEKEAAAIYAQELPLAEDIYGAGTLPHAEPTLARDKSFASYTSPIAHSWPNDPFVKGSYSYVAADQEEVLGAMHQENGETVKSLFAPIEHRLYFAGEHASILTDVPGTMEAACESGARAARMLIAALPAG